MRGYTCACKYIRCIEGYNFRPMEKKERKKKE